MQFLSLTSELATTRLEALVTGSLGWAAEDREHEGGGGSKHSKSSYLRYHCFTNYTLAILQRYHHSDHDAILLYNVGKARCLVYFTPLNKTCMLSPHRHRFRRFRPKRVRVLLWQLTTKNSGSLFQLFHHPAVCPRAKKKQINNAKHALGETQDARNTQKMQNKSRWFVFFVVCWFVWTQSISASSRSLSFALIRARSLAPLKTRLPTS